MSIINKPSRICLLQESNLYLLSQPVPSTGEASYSFILSLASFINRQFPSLLPPSLLQNSTIKEEMWRGQQTSLATNGLYQPWCDFLTQQVFNRKFQVIGGQFIIVIQMTENFVKEIKELPHHFMVGSKNQENLSKNIKEQFYPESLCTKKTEKSRRIAILNLSTSVLNENPLKVKIHLEGLMAGIWLKQGDSWSAFRILKKEIPSVSELNTFDVIILTGSSLNINESPQEVYDLLRNINQCVKNNKKIKVIGTCFGHQAIAFMLGCKVTLKDLIARPERIVFKKQYTQQHDFFTKLNFEQSSTLDLCEYHSLFVEEIPQKFINIASTEECPNECMVSEDGQFLSFQFHPEYSGEFIQAFQTRVCEQNGNNWVANYKGKKLPTNHKNSLIIMRTVIEDFIEEENQANLIKIEDEKPDVRNKEKLHCF